MTALYTITHRGVPVGTVELPPSGERVTVAVTPLSAYEAIRPLVRMASRALTAKSPAGRTADTKPSSPSRADGVIAASEGRGARDVRGN